MARGYDLIGSKGKAVAIVEVRDEDAEAGLEKAIAERLMKSNKHIVSVLKKESAREGEFRMREYSRLYARGPILTTANRLPSRRLSSRPISIAALSLVIRLLSRTFIPQNVS